MQLGSREIGLTAALLLLTSPSFWFDGEVALSYVVEGCAAIALRLIVAASAGVNVVEWDLVALLTGVWMAGTAGVVAALGPSSRAARVDPNTVLRAD